MDKLNREYRLGLYEKSMPSTLTWVEKLTIAKKSGFDYLEISIDESDAKLALSSFVSLPLLSIPF